MARIAGLDLNALDTAYQPIVDLRDGSTVGYEALMRGPEHSPLARPHQLLAAARAEDRVADLDRASRAAAIRTADEHGLTAPFSLFVNADADTLLAQLPDRAGARFTLVVDVTEAALVARPEMLLRALSRLRTLGWGIALDDIGADSRSLALMSLVYPDVIKLDLRRLRERSARDVARIVAAAGAESERRQAAVLAEGIDGEEQLATARAYGATLGEGYLLGPPAPLPAVLQPPGRGLRLTGGGADPDGSSAFRRITNWRRPTPGTRELAACAAGLLLERAAGIGETALVLAALPDPRAEQLERCVGSPTTPRSSASSPPTARSRAPGCARARSSPATRWRSRGRSRCSTPTTRPASSPGASRAVPGRSPPRSTATPCSSAPSR